MEAVRTTVRLDRPFELWLLDAALACCAVEFVAAMNRRADLERCAVTTGPTDRPAASVLVVSGTVTDRLAPGVRRLYESMPEPRYVLSFGACANSGGPYWDSYCVTKGVDQLLPVDVYVPGCPPGPHALFDALAVLRERIEGAAG